MHSLNFLPAFLLLLVVAGFGQTPQAAVNLDVPAIAGVSLFVAVVYITVNFIVDVLYGVIDPRIRVR